MIRRIIQVVVLLLLLLLISACTYGDNWRNIDIPNYGTFQVPQTWELSEKDGFLYLSTSENGVSRDVLVQYSANGSKNAQFADTEELVWLHDEYFSNSTGITKYEVHYQDGKIEELYVLEITGLDDKNDFIHTKFLCLDSTVSEKTLKKIAKSYRMED